MEKVSFWDVVKNRRSVRRFKEEVPSREIVNRIMEAALMAPSGKNSQNWYFKVIFNKSLINKIAEVILDKNRKISQCMSSEKGEKFRKFSRYSTFFRDAPILILAFAGEYRITGYDEMAGSGLEDEAEAVKASAPGIQNIAAAFENLLLASEAAGLSGCWMTSPNYAAKEIREAAGPVPEGYRLAAMTPLGYPVGKTEGPVKKSIAEKVEYVI